MRIYNPPRASAIAITQTTINLETITVDRQLNNTSAQIQNLTNPGSTQLNLFLPSIPEVGKQFLIINKLASNGNFYINNSFVFPGDRYEIIFDGVEWVEL